MTRKFTLEHMIEIWDDDGNRLEVGPDRDGLRLLEIRERAPDGKIVTRITLPHDQARLLIEALKYFTALPGDQP